MRYAIIISVLAAFALTQNAAKAQTSDGDLENRLLRLEEQIVDLSAHVGTLETLANSGAAASAPPSSAPLGGTAPVGDGGPVDERINFMETQLRALSDQIGDLINRVNQLEGGGGGGLPSRGGGDTFREGNAGDGFGTTVEGGGSGDAGQDTALNTYFGDAPQNTIGGSGSTAPIQTALQSSPQAQALYDEGYNALLQRNYRAATSTFSRFVEEFPTDPLAGQAYFWLGESAFVNGEYRQAADSFLKSSTNYPDNQKAAESLLKLGISLKRLDENAAACSSFTELVARFPAASDIVERAQREKQRTDCT